MLRKKPLINKRRNTKKWKWLLMSVIMIVVIILASYYTYNFYGKKHNISQKVTRYIVPTPKQQDITVLKSLLTQKNITYSKINTTQSEYIIYLANGSEVILSTQKDLYSQISSLQYILSRLTMEGRQFIKLDERFDNPVIVLDK